MALTVVACAGAAAVSLYAASRTWLVETVPRPAPMPDVSAARTGGDLVPLLPAVALVALATAGALLATRGRARGAVGVLMGGCGLAIASLATHSLLGYSDLAVIWPVVCVAAGAVLLLAGIATLRAGQAWPSMGSRYDRPAAAPSRDSGTGMWEALDRGTDPTA